MFTCQSVWESYTQEIILIKKEYMISNINREKKLNTRLEIPQEYCYLGSGNGRYVHSSEKLEGLDWQDKLHNVREMLAAGGTIIWTQMDQAGVGRECRVVGRSGKYTLSEEVGVSPHSGR